MDKDSTSLPGTSGGSDLAPAELPPLRWKDLRDGLPPLRALSEKAATGEDLGEVVACAMQSLVRLASGSKVVMLVSPDEQEAMTGGGRSASSVDLASGVELSMDGEVAQLIRDWEGNDRPVLLEHGTRLILPLPSGGAAVLHPATGVLRDEDRLETMLVLLRWARGAIRFGTQLYEARRRSLELEDTRRRLREQTVLLSELAVVDELTGLHNRRYLDRRFEYEVERFHRYGQPLSFALVDVDHFAQLNEVYGTAVGDAILRALAELGRQAMRNVDLIARFGGEEFALLMPDTDLPGARVAVGRLHDIIDRAVFPLDGDELRVTVSAGVATVSAGWCGDMEALVRLADQALFKAKEAGRNRIEQAFIPPVVTEIDDPQPLLSQLE